MWIKWNDLLSVFWDENYKVLHWILYSQTWVSVSAFSLTGCVILDTHYFYLFVCLFWSHRTACRILVPQPNTLWLALWWSFALMQYSFYCGGPKLNSWHLWDVPVSVWVSAFNSFAYIFPRSGIPGSCIVLCLNFWETDQIVCHSFFFLIFIYLAVPDVSCSTWDLWSLL